jgi:hypothetical protein
MVSLPQHVVVPVASVMSVMCPVNMQNKALSQVKMMAFFT